MIKITNLIYPIAKAPVIDNISLTLKEMEIIGICGPPGSGKTTLLQILAGKLKNYAGSIKLNNSELSSIPANIFNKQVVIGDSDRGRFNEESTLYNFILSGRRLYKKFLNPYDENDHHVTEDIIQELHMENMKNSKLKTLSHSALQIARIGKILVSQSNLTLLDNPERCLNINQKKTMFTVLKKHASGNGKNVVIASGDINFMTNLCDRIIIIDNGKIIEDKRPENISAEILETIFKTRLVMIKNIITGKNEFQIIEE